MLEVWTVPVSVWDALGGFLFVLGIPALTAVPYRLRAWQDGEEWEGWGKPEFYAAGLGALAAGEAILIAAGADRNTGRALVTWAALSVWAVIFLMFHRAQVRWTPAGLAGAAALAAAWIIELAVVVSRIL